jgi:tetratricopeptide (TPR) repeat protein
MIEGAAHRARNAVAEAESAYRAALAAEPTSTVARIELAMLLLTAGRSDEARALAAAVNAEQPEYVPALLALGMVEAAGSRYTEARRWFEEAVRLEEREGKGPGYARALAPLIETQLALRDLESAAAGADALLAADPQSPLGRYLMGRIEFEQGDAASAEERLEALLVDAPSFWQAHVLLGMINAAQQQLGQAEMYLRTAATNAPQNTTARLLLAEIYLRQNNVASARAVLADARGVVENGLAAALAGRASLAAGEAGLAAEFFDRSERGKPRNLRELVELAGVYVAAGELDRAVRVLDSASFAEEDSDALIGYLLSIVQLRRGDHAAAAATAERLSAERPEAAWPAALRGTIALAQGDNSAARRFFETALEREPDYVPALLSLARVSVASGDADGAVAHLRRVLELDPQSLDAILGMVQLAVQRGDFAEAETWVASAPESAQRFVVEGNLHAARRRYADAAVAFERAFALQPSAALALRAYAASRQARRPDADAVLLAWLERQPTDPDVNFALGSQALERGEDAAAISRYEAAVAANPRHGPALNNLAWLYDQRGDDRALDFARRAHDVVPNDPAVVDTLGWLYVRRGDAAAGLPLLERAARDASNPEIRYHYAVALAETGAAADAAALLDELVSGAAEFASRDEARERLARLRQAR